MPTGDDRLRLRQAVKDEVPERPGVYIWFGAGNAPAYVGKSVNLRQRMLSYLSESAADPLSRRRHLAFAITGFEVRETPGELLALLLEDALIKRWSPRYNVRQRDYLERRYLLLTDDPFPTCLNVEGASPRSGALFGPFKDRYFVGQLIDLIDDVFGLRACEERQPVRRSSRFELGRCLGPCRQAISVDDYAAVAMRVRQFLDGDGTWAEAVLKAEMDQSSSALAFERAAGARERIEFCRRFATRQRFLQAFRDEPLVLEEPRFGLTYRFERGTPTAVAGLSGTVPLPAELTTPVTDLRHLLDRGNVVYEWNVNRQS